MDADTGDTRSSGRCCSTNSMASMTFDRAKKAAEASSLAKRYRAIIQGGCSQCGNRRPRQGDRGRRNQISMLGRTGALTQGEKKEKQSLDELRALLSKLQERKQLLESEARDLIGRIVRLGYLKEERAQTRANLDETRRVLEEVGGKPERFPRHCRGRFARQRSRPSVRGQAKGHGWDWLCRWPRHGFALIACGASCGRRCAVKPILLRSGRMVVGAGSLEKPEDSVHGLRNSLHVALARQPSDHGRAIGVIGAGRAQGVTTLALALAHPSRRRLTDRDG